MGKCDIEFFLIHFIPFLSLHFKKSSQWLEIFHIVFSGFTVPRAYILAYVATESPVPEFPRKFPADLIPVFNGQIGYATVCIDRSARQNGIGRDTPLYNGCNHRKSHGWVCHIEGECLQLKYQ